MLQIRAEQMEALSAYMFSEFEKRMVVHLRATFPDRTQDIDEQKLSKVIQQGIEKARSYNVIYEDDIRRFIEYLVIYGPRMDTKASTRWMGEILRREDINGTVKMDLVDEAELAAIRT